MFCLELRYSVEKYITGRCSRLAVSIGNNIFPNTVKKLEFGTEVWIT
jgi:hypothetical protein